MKRGKIVTHYMVLDLAREALARVLDNGVTAHRRQMVTAIQNLWEKYRIPLAARERVREEVVTGRNSSPRSGQFFSD